MVLIAVSTSVEGRKRSQDMLFTCQDQVCIYVYSTRLVMR